MAATQFTPQTSKPPTLAACPSCAATMVLRQINPHSPGFESRVFDCPECGEQDAKVFKSPELR
jgi:predicted RNA-binding Zn-ribbon protein involved in translation (DUF1610 family)